MNGVAYIAVQRASKDLAQSARPCAPVVRNARRQWREPFARLSRTSRQSAS